jgi:hypothetical protein
MYAEFEDDPKVQMLPEALQARLVKVFCTRCKEEKLTDMQRAFKWRISLEEVAETKKVFLANGFIDADWNVINWNKRQFLSDSSTERVRKYRQALKQNETFHETDGNVTVTALEQNRADADQTQKRKDSPEFQWANDLIVRMFDFYCEALDRDRKRYTLTDKRKEKALLRIRERFKVHKGDKAKVENDIVRAIENLAGSDFHRSGGYIDWEAQIFRSAEEFEKRLTWSRPNGKTQSFDRGVRSEQAIHQRASARASDPESNSGVGLADVLRAQSGANRVDGKNVLPGAVRSDIGPGRGTGAADPKGNKNVAKPAGAA